jgi:hypothetical protein
MAVPRGKLDDRVRAVLVRHLPSLPAPDALKLDQGKRLRLLADSEGYKPCAIFLIIHLKPHILRTHSKQHKLRRRLP